MKHIELSDGFRSGSSCEPQLLVTISNFMKSYDADLQTDTHWTLPKASDTVYVPHKNLL